MYFPEMDFSEGHRTSLRPSEPSFLETGFGTGSGAGSGFRTRPLSTPINAMSALELDEPICDAAWPKTGSETGFGRFDVDGNLFGSNDNDGNHSSEEELEEINNKVVKPFYLQLTAGANDMILAYHRYTTMK